MNAGVGWAFIGVGAGIGITYLVAFGLARAAAAADRCLGEFGDAPDVVDDLMAITDGPQDRDRSHRAAPDDVLVGEDFELWRFECGWSS